MDRLRKTVHQPDIDHGPRVSDVIEFVQNSHNQCLVERVYGLLDDSHDGLETICSLSKMFDVHQAQQVPG